MRWIAFAILLYTITVMQSTVAPFIAVHTIRPDLMVIVAAYYALLAQTYDALLVCWLIGMAADLTSLSFANHSNVGVHALCLGLIAIVVVSIRSLTFRESVLTQLIFAFLIKLTLDILVGLHMLYVLDQWDRIGEIFTMALWASIYTALLAPYLHWVLRRFRGLLGIGTTHRLRVR